MRRLDFAVPEPVLTGHAAMLLARETAAAGGLWLSAKTVASAAEGGHAALPLWPLAEPADEVFWPVVDGAGSRIEAGPRGRAALCLTPGVNGGYGDANAVRSGNSFSAAVVWAPSQTPAKTLLCLRGASRQDNYVFLSEEAPGTLVLRDNAGEHRIETSCPVGAGWAAAAVSVHGGRLRLTVAGRPVLSVEGAQDLPGSARLLVGCRAPRGGMPKSLGAARISDLFYWPGVDVLAECGDPAGASLLRAFDDFCLWEL